MVEKSTQGKQCAGKITGQKGEKKMRIFGLLNEKGERFHSGNPTVLVDDKGIEHLYSYDTEIMTKHKNGKFYRVWSGWTQTTGRHIHAFSGLAKAGFDNLPYEK